MAHCKKKRISHVSPILHSPSPCVLFVSRLFAFCAIGHSSFITNMRASRMASLVWRWPLESHCTLRVQCTATNNHRQSHWIRSMWSFFVAQRQLSTLFHNWCCAVNRFFQTIIISWETENMKQSQKQHQSRVWNSSITKPQGPREKYNLIQLSYFYTCIHTTKDIRLRRAQNIKHFSPVGKFMPKFIENVNNNKTVMLEHFIWHIR